MEEFIDNLKKSKFIIFRTEFDDVRNFTNIWGNKYKIIKVKKGIVIIGVDGFKENRKIDIPFLKYWFDEYKLTIE